MICNIILTKFSVVRASYVAITIVRYVADALDGTNTGTLPQCVIVPDTMSTM